MGSQLEDDLITIHYKWFTLVSSLSLPALFPFHCIRPPSTMACRRVLLLAPLCFLLLLTPRPTSALSSCGGPCRTLNDCAGQLICIGGKCNDDPDVGTHICAGGAGGGRGGGSGGSGGACRPSQPLVCGVKTYPTYSCSPPVTSATKAILTNNDFSEGGDGGAESSCDGKFHSNSESIVALSTGWFNSGSRCNKLIRITAPNGRSTTAKVVDECDSLHGCDAEHAFQPPCGNNIVDGSNAVWNALGLNIDDGKVPVTWTMA